MQIQFLKATWGMNDIPSFGDKLRAIAAAGYDGFEHNIVGDVPEGFGELLDETGLTFAAQLITTSADEMVELMEKCAPYKPALFVCHSGRDYFTFEQGKVFFEKVHAAQERLGIPVAHETHRHRMLYSPYPTRDYLNALPDLRINADFSHWCCVCECLLEEIGEIVDLACSRAIHIHARVGYGEAPQVADPRDPIYESAVNAHAKWWDAIRANAEQEGRELLTVVPEYGPWPYMPIVPYSHEPVADLWEVCLWQANWLRERWGLPIPEKARQ